MGSVVNFDLPRLEMNKGSRAVVGSEREPARDDLGETNMSKLHRTVLTTLAFSLGLGASGLAYADSTVDYGRVVSIRINAQGSDDFGKFRGEVTLARKGDTKKAPPILDSYKFGGTNCSGKDLSVNQIDQLQNALTHRAHLRVRPYYKPGPGGIKCMVGFDVTGREAAKPPAT